MTRRTGRSEGDPKSRAELRALLMAAAAAKSLQSCPSLCDPIDGSPPGSSVPGIPRQGYVAKSWTGVLALRQQLPTRASLPCSPQASTRSQSRTYTNTVAEHRVVHTDTYKGEDTGKGNPRQHHRRLRLQAPRRFRHLEPHTAPPLPGGKHLAIWNLSGLSVCKQVVFRTCLIKRQQTTQPGIESSWYPWEGGLFSACGGLPPAPRPSAQVRPYVKSSEVEPLSESGAPPSLHEAGNVSNCPICFLDLSRIPLKSGIKHGQQLWGELTP